MVKQASCMSRLFYYHNRCLSSLKYIQTHKILPNLGATSFQTSNILPRRGLQSNPLLNYSHRIIGAGEHALYIASMIVEDNAFDGSLARKLA